jgi:hypothetical protein
VEPPVDQQSADAPGVIDVRGAAAAPPGQNPPPGDDLIDLGPAPRPTSFQFAIRPQRSARLRTSALVVMSSGVGLTVVALAALLVVRPRDLAVTAGSVPRLVVGCLVAIVLVATLCSTGILLIRSREAAREENLPLPRLRPSGSLPEQFTLTEEQIAKYQALALEQARVSFGQSQQAMRVALLLLVSGGVAVIFLDNERAQLVIGGLAALGSTFAAFLGSTFLTVYRQATAQLNHSHSIPLAKNLVLLADLVTARVETKDVRESMVKDIVTATLAVARTGPVTPQVPPRLRAMRPGRVPPPPATPGSPSGPGAAGLTNGD